MSSVYTGHPWGASGAPWEGQCASSMAIFCIIDDMIARGRVASAVATWLALDGYLRGQDWKQLRGEDVFVAGEKGTALQFASPRKHASTIDAAFEVHIVVRLAADRKLLRHHVQERGLECARWAAEYQRGSIAASHFVARHLTTPPHK